MLIVGYQGIGKSSTAKNANGYIDLESDNFWLDGQRTGDWYILYCRIAVHLSEQGYKVFTSSHPAVRHELRKSKEKKIIICPHIDLKVEWIRRLKTRYDQTKSDKDYKAYVNTKDMYTENIQHMLSDKNFDKIVITKVPYVLDRVIQKYLHSGD